MDFDTEPKKAPRFEWAPLLWAVLFVVGVLALITTAAFNSDDEDPAEFHRKERQSCLDRGGTVKEDAYGYYNGCLYSES